MLGKQLESVQKIKPDCPANNRIKTKRSFSSKKCLFLFERNIEKHLKHKNSKVKKNKTEGRSAVVHEGSQPVQPSGLQPAQEPEVEDLQLVI